MQKRSRGHIVLMGSVTSYFGWPTLAAYGATKAALNNMADALRYDFEKMNIRIQIINPGFVDTPLAAKNTHLMPALMPVEKASRRMVKAIRSGGYETTFPWRLTWGLKFMRAWPHEPLFAFMNYVDALARLSIEAGPDAGVAAVGYSKTAIDVAVIPSVPIS